MSGGDDDDDDDDDDDNAEQQQNVPNITTDRPIRRVTEKKSDMFCHILYITLRRGDSK